MPAARQNLSIEQGATFRLSLQWAANNAPMDITGYVARMQIRSEVASSTVIHELTSENGGIIFEDAATGKIQLYISSNNTAGFNFKRGVYDLELEAPSGDVIRLIEGSVTLSLEVTRD